MKSYNPWSQHFQSVWQERSGNPRFPLWLRVASLAYGKHKANGHANFRHGEVAMILSTINPTTGEINQPDRRAVHRAIRVAVSNGFLAQGSRSTCLVVPAHAVSGGEGNPHAPCPVHERAKQPRAA